MPNRQPEVLATQTASSNAPILSPEAEREQQYWEPTTDSFRTCHSFWVWPVPTPRKARFGSPVSPAWSPGPINGSRRMGIGPRPSRPL